MSATSASADTLINVVYCHVGKIFPNHIFQSIYQTLLWNTNTELQIYVILDREYIRTFRQQIYDLGLDVDSIGKVFVIPSESLSSELLSLYLKETELWHKERNEFRGQFWISTTSRFFYIEALVSQFGLENVFHIENDVLIYKNLSELHNTLTELGMSDKIVAVQDAAERAVCSLVYIPDAQNIMNFTKFIVTSVSQTPAQNDMELMGKYKDKYHFPDSPNHKKAPTLGVYDANGIGQFLGGIDFKNIPKEMIKNKWINPTVGFINETATFKPNTAEYGKITYGSDSVLKKYIIRSKDKDLDNTFRELNVIHVHSKHLHLFSSTFDLSFADFITGDTVLHLCDLVFIDTAQFNYNRHLHLHKTLDNVIHVKDFNNINIGALKEIVDERADLANSINKKKTINLFVYIDIMANFQYKILPHLPDNYNYIIYSHNGDYSFDKKYDTLLDNPKVLKVFAQNIDHEKHPKLHFLPIGIARTMFAHGNLSLLYETMVETYYKKKKDSVFININTTTYPKLREPIMNSITRNASYTLYSNQDYKTYLEALSTHRFSLCIRGNGIDTHRFWESLYLGVIPVIYDDGSFRHFIECLDENKIPYYKIESMDFFSKNDSDFFSETLYKKILHQNDIHSLGLCKFLKLGNYR